MENSGPKQQTPEDNMANYNESTDKKKSKKSENRGLDLWQKLFHDERNSLASDENIESADDDDEEEQSPLVKAWKSLGKTMRLGFFQGESEKNEDNINTETNKPLISKQDKSEEISSEINSENTHEPEIDTNSTDETDEEIEKIINKDVADPLQIEKPNKTEVEQPKQPAIINDIDEQQYELQKIHDQIEDQKSVSNLSNIEAPQPNVNEKVTERVIERGMGGALPTVLLGFEYLGRKRADKKQEKKIVATQKQINNLESQEIKSNIKIQEMQLKNQRIEDEINNLKVESQKAKLIENKTAETAIGLGRASITSAESQGQEIKKELTHENRRTKQPGNKPIMPENINFTPEKVTERVIKAAEYGEAIEKQFELRQELKGNNFKAGSSVNPLFDQIESQTSLTDRQSSNNVNNNQKSNFKLNDPVIYNQAVKNGFWGAIVIVVFAALVYLFYRTIT